MAFVFGFLAASMMVVVVLAMRWVGAQRRIWKRAGYRLVTVAGAAVIIKRLDPLDFLEEKEGVPVTLFSRQRLRGLAEALGDKDEGQSRADQVDAIKKIVRAGVVRLPGKLVVDDFFQPGTMAASLDLYALILDHSMSRLTRNYTASENTLILYDQMSQRYGKLPHQCLAIESRMTALEKAMFDSFVFGAGLEHEVRAHKKAVQKMKRKNNGR